MASSSEFFAGAKNVATKIKDYVVGVFSPLEEDALLEEDEVFEEDDVKNNKPAVSMSEQRKEIPERTRRPAPQPREVERIQRPAPVEARERRPEPAAASRGSIYAHRNEYTGIDSYEDNSSVDFSLARNTSFERRPAVERVPASSSVVFGNTRPSEPAQSVPFASPVTASGNRGSEIRGSASAERDFSFSGATEPVTFRSRPNTRYESRTLAFGSEPVKADDNAEAVRAKAVVGFNTTAAAGTPSGTPYSGGAARATNYGGKSMDNLTVQVLRPKEISEASFVGSLLKKGIVVVCNLSEIPDKNTRIRFSDYLCGCCKGCDASFSEIISVESSTAVLIAVPSNVNLINSVDAPQAPAEDKTKAKPAPKVEVPDPNDFFSFTPSEPPRAGGFFDVM